MRKLIVTSVLAALSFAAPMLVTSQAHAGLDACGDINLSASATCTAEVSGGCKAKCTPISFYAECAGRGYASCEGQCDLPSVDCDASCQGSCEGTCGANPDFSCSANCQGSCGVDCSGTCDGQCASSANQAECKGQCEAQCKATCQGECDASCNGAPVECNGSCEASCSGSCKAKTNMDCQVSCQAKLEVSCEAELKGGCEVACDAPGGAVFCDGQYVDKNGHGQECLDAITANVNAHASASAECSGGSCTAEGEAGCGLGMVSPNGPSGTPYYLAGLAALAGIAVGKLRRRR